MEIDLILAIIIFILGVIVSFIISRLFRDLYWKEQIKNQRKEAVKKSREVLSGQFSEQLAPILPGFNYEASECKFLGSPIDYIVFEGSSKGEINRITFLEVKSGESKLSGKEKSIKKAIEDGKVFFDEYRA